MLEVGKTYIIDKDSPNGGKVILLECFTYFCMVQDPETGEKWSTMCYRLTDEEGIRVGENHVREATMNRRSAVSVQRVDLMKQLGTAVTTTSTVEGMKKRLGRIGVVGVGAMVDHVAAEITRTQNVPTVVIHPSDAKDHFEEQMNRYDKDIKAIELKTSGFNEEAYLYSRGPKTPPLYQAEKIRTKPCTRHEYVQGMRTIDGGVINNKWVCKHCRKEL